MVLLADKDPNVRRPDTGREMISLHPEAKAFIESLDQRQFELVKKYFDAVDSVVMARVFGMGSDDYSGHVEDGSESPLEKMEISLNSQGIFLPKEDHVFSSLVNYFDKARAASAE